MNRLIPFIAIAALIFQVGLGLSSSPSIVNAHESIENAEDIAKLTSAMARLNISDIVLHGIPEDYLRYDEEAEIDLSAIGNNHELILEAVESYPGKFHYVCTLDPEDSLRMNLLEECIENGAVGVKFYVGYAVSHTYNIDNPALGSFLERMAEAELFLMLPVNTTLFGAELEVMLAANPDLDVVCPHYCLSSTDLEWLGGALDKYPNLYVDTSFGSTRLFESGFARMSENHDAFVAFFDKYQDRILFATDNVITSYEDKTEEWVTQLYSDYISMMTEGEFISAINPDLTYVGLDLTRAIQQKVFWRNWNALIE